MLETRDILGLFERENIALLPHILPYPCLGLYIRDAHHPFPVVLYHRQLESPSAEPLHRVVLLEELGHHWTIKPHNLSGTVYTHAIYVGKNESSGYGLAADLAMPPSRVYQMMSEGWTAEELAQYFRVTPEMAHFQMERIARNPKGSPCSLALIKRICGHSKRLLARYKGLGVGRVG